MTSNAKLDFPEPESPVTRASVPRGISTLMFFRLCCRAPRTVIRSIIRPEPYSDEFRHPANIPCYARVSPSVKPKASVLIWAMTEDLTPLHGLHRLLEWSFFFLNSSTVHGTHPFHRWERPHWPCLLQSEPVPLCLFSRHFVFPVLFGTGGTRSSVTGGKISRTDYWQRL